MTDPSQADPENARGLVVRTLSSFASTLSPDFARGAAAMSIIIPMLLTRAAGESEANFKETAARLLELASADQTAFRSVVGKMSGEQKALMEKVIRQGRASEGRDAGREDRDESGEPSIALILDFGRS